MAIFFKTTMNSTRPPPPPSPRCIPDSVWNKSRKQYSDCIKQSLSDGDIKMSKIEDALNPLIKAINAHTELILVLQKQLADTQRQVRDLSKSMEMSEYLISDDTVNDSKFKKVSDLKGNKDGRV